MKALDYSFSRPSIAGIVAAGCAGVVRYVSTGDKGLTHDEASRLRAAGLWIAPVYEGAAGDAKLGQAKGQVDAKFANDELDTIGCPASAAVFYACDESATVEQVRPYFIGVKSEGRRPRGWYGGLGVGLQLQAEGLVDYVWPANATSWSGFHTFAELEAAAHQHHVAMLQHLDHPLVGIDPRAYDYDEVITPFPAWGLNPQGAPVVPPHFNIKLDHPITGYLSVPGVGAWICTQDGGVFTLSGHFFGSAAGKDYFKGRSCSNIVVNPNAAERKQHPYVLVDSTGHTYGIAGF